MRERLKTLLLGTLLVALGAASLYAAALELRTRTALRAATADPAAPPSLRALASISGDARLPRAVAHAHLRSAGLFGDPAGTRRRTARAAYALAVQRNPLDAAAWRELGRLQLGAGDFAGAERSLETAVALAPASAEALRALARLRERADLPCAARDLYRRSLRLQANAVAEAALEALPEGSSRERRPC